MSSDRWNSKTHVIPTAHVRGLERVVRSEKKDKLQLAVKQFTPKNKKEDASHGFTIIMAHGIASAKECFEPFLDELYDQDVPVQSVWAPDAVFNGESYHLNRSIYGDQVDWLDFSRDIWHMINYFQDQMPAPIVGLGESLGCGILALVSSWHPRLFAGLALFDPALGPRIGTTWPAPAKFHPGALAVRRKNTWPSLEAARTAFAKNRYYKDFDKRVFEKMLQYSLREDTDDAEFGKFSSTTTAPVTLTTPSHIEAYTWFTPMPPLPGFPYGPSDIMPPPFTDIAAGFGRFEAHRFYESLPSMSPPTLIVWGKKSPLTPDWKRFYYLSEVGTGVGGNGGIKSGNVKQAVVDSGHPVCQEKPAEAAAAVAPWLKSLWKSWNQHEDAKAQQPAFVNHINPEFMKRIEKL